MIARSYVRILSHERNSARACSPRREHAITTPRILECDDMRPVGRAWRYRPAMAYELHAGSLGNMRRSATWVTTLHSRLLLLAAMR